ncbi:MAG: hypothetical protein AB2598_16925 [Candidatus Thiodiazotropha sp.]
MNHAVYLVIILVLLVFLIRQHLKPNVRLYGERIDAAAYLDGKAVPALDIPAELEFRFVHASSPFTSDATLLMIVNGHLAYRGDWQPVGLLRFPRPKDYDLIHCRLEVVDQNLLYIFDHKNVFYWQENFHFLYVVLWPDATGTDLVLFFPQEHEVIQ